MKELFISFMQYAIDNGELLEASFRGNSKYSNITFKNEKGTFSISLSKEEEKTNE